MVLVTIGKLLTPNENTPRCMAMMGVAPVLDMANTKSCPLSDSVWIDVNSVIVEGNTEVISTIEGGEEVGDKEEPKLSFKMRFVEVIKNAMYSPQWLMISRSFVGLVVLKYLLDKAVLAIELP